MAYVHAPGQQSAQGTSLLRNHWTMNPRIDSWTGRRVWVIGASTGIGAETARMLLAFGARVALSARQTDALEEVAAGHRDARVLPLDVTRHDQVLAVRDLLLADWGGIDLVLIVAGAYSDMRADNFDMAVVNRLIDVNLRGVFHCVDAALPVLLRTPGSGIGIVSSVAGFFGLPRTLAYGPTKAALINLAESLYFDLHPRGNAIYLINPGFVATPATASNDFDMPGLISAPEAAAHIVRGIERGAFQIHFPRNFTNWMRFGRVLPYRWYFWLTHKVTGL